ncbi:MAG: hypothetical protein AAFP90_16100, partial [Planctomycetota bacterium]
MSPLGLNPIDSNQIPRPSSRRLRLMRICRGGAIGLAFLCAAWMPAIVSAQFEEPAAQTTPSESDDEELSDDEFESVVLELVDQLEAGEIAKRKAAEAELTELGPRVLPLLPDIDTLSLEARLRVERIRKKVSKAKAVELSGPIRVNLASCKTIGAALDAIEEASGVTFQGVEVRGTSFSPPGTPVPFWQAVDQVLDAADLDLDSYGGSRTTLLLVQRAAGRPPRALSAGYAGVYRLEPISVTAQRNLINESMNSLAMTVQIAWEPNITPLGLRLPIDGLSAQLDDGNDLLPQSQQGGAINVAANVQMNNTEVYLPMQLPAGRPKSVSTMAGSIEALLPNEAQDFEFEMKDAGGSQTRGSATVILDDVSKNDALTEVRVRLKFDDPDGNLESHQQWAFDNNAYVKGPDGKRIDPLGMEAYTAGASGVGIKFLFQLDDNLADLKLVYQTPTIIQ